MRMYWRLFNVMLCALLRRANIGLSDESILHFTIMPWDCVVKLSGNDRYHAFMDLGRIDLLIRMGGWNAIAFEHLQPFVATVDIRYRYPLRMFQVFDLRTRLVRSDSRFFWMEHIFQCGQRVMATAISKNIFTHGNKIVATADVFSLLSRTSSTSNR